MDTLPVSDLPPAMKRLIFILGTAGAARMMFVLYGKSLVLAMVSNYPGVFAARWVQYRGIAHLPKRFGFQRLTDADKCC